MSKFIYSSGDRPLNGYVIKRGIGQGGFGEVYYAVSEAGKEVALKLVRGNAEVELRGMQQCINLKHQNLVSLYDIKTDDQGDHWVIMEYVAGESLNQVLSRHPSGLTIEQSQSIFGELCQAMQALHESGIVHRDLKPANVFIENSMVKVGDYGLCKFISGTQKSPQTQSIGTVHYMAPEISTGNYGKQVDIYAAGVMLYEMMTGKLPFDGETVGEILMKHLTSQPDLSMVPKEYAGVIGKSLVKNPAERFQTFNEFAEAVAKVAGKTVVRSAPRPIASPLASLAPPSPAAPTTPYPTPPSNGSPYPFGSISRDKVTELCWSMVQATLFSVLGILIWAAIAGPSKGTFHPREYLGLLNTLILTSWAVLITGKFWDGRVADPWPRRTILLACGLAIGAFSGFMNPVLLDARTASSFTAGSQFSLGSAASSILFRSGSVRDEMVGIDGSLSGQPVQFLVHDFDADRRRNDLRDHVDGQREGGHAEPESARRVSRGADRADHGQRCGAVLQPLVGGAAEVFQKTPLEDGVTSFVANYHLPDTNDLY
ncbi:MAG: serine/threonine-protein kinase [Gemmatales bacterium]